MKILLALFFSVVIVQSTKLGIRVIRHQPCHSGNPSITFSSSDKAQVVEDGDTGCYKVIGAVKVTRDIKGSINVYVESRNGTRAEPVDCKNADSNNCNGIGSCIYCDACNSIKSTTATKNNVQLLVDDKPTDCAKGLKTGEYDNVSLRFCAPELDDFLKSQGLDRKSWDEVIGPRGTTIYMSIHIFDFAINTMSKAELAATMASGREIGCHKLVVNVFSGH